MIVKNPHISHDVFEKEIESVTSRREDKEKVEENLVGLALSGGGIRSATFGLGVLEGMKSRGLLKKVDYLSTVSGGGYIGAWLSANCKRAAERAAVLADNKEAHEVPEAYKEASKPWLDDETDWTKSIEHLRRYSNYLSPKVGFFSADTWSMVTVWLRNTLLVQLTVILAIAAVLLVPRLLFEIFQKWPHWQDARWTTVVLFILAVAGIAGNQWQLNRDGDVPFLRWFAGLLVATVFLLAAYGLKVLFHFNPFADGKIEWLPAALIAFCLVLAGFCLLPTAVVLIGKGWLGCDPPKQINYSQGWVQGLVVIPMMMTGFLLAAVLWGQTVGANAFGELAKLDSFNGFFTNAWHYWPFPLSIAFVSLWLFSFFSIRSWRDWKGLLAAFLAPIPAVLVLHALLCVIMLMLHGWKPPDVEQLPVFELRAFVWAPAMVLYAFSLSIVMLIGMMGRQSTEGVREWWSRLGAWLGIYGFAWMLIAVAAVYVPKLAAIILDSQTWSVSITGGWLVTTLAGLLAGKSDSTGSVRKSAQSEKTSTEKLMNLVATIGPFFFIVGLLIGISTCLDRIILSTSDLNWCDSLAPYWKPCSNITCSPITVMLVATFVCLLLLVGRVDINEFSLNAFYRSRLSRCYLGASRFLPGERNPQKFTEFDEKDDLRMADLQGTSDRPPAGPLHIINCALNLGGSSDLALHTRHSASFTLTPYYAGSEYRSKDSSGVRQPLGYQKIAEYGGRDGQPTLGQTISVSGAAASPNMGYHTSPVVAFLLTVFNVRLGWWFPNPKKPRKSPSPCFSLRYLVKELFGGADDKSNFLMISDGGHFENLAAYELIRRRCRVIIISDAECDPELKFEGLGSLIRMCEVDFGTKITLDVDGIRPDPESDWSSLRYALGQIDYGYADNNKIPDGVLIYLKASMTGHEDTSVLQYKASHPAFPHESTGDQFYGEDQFESYRRLGREVADTTFRSVNCKLDFVTIAKALLKKFPPPSK